MVSFKKTATLLLFARICECDAQKEHASTLVSTNTADNERSNRSLLLDLPDCSNPENHGKAQCICRNPFNAGMDLCKKWFEEVSVKSKSTIFSGIDTRIIGGSDVSNGDYPWFAKLTRGTEWAGCGGALVSPQFVLTAAHCVENFDGFEIGALCHSSNEKPNENCGQDSQVISADEIIRYPNYNGYTLNNDYALVRLSSPATGVTPVTMDMDGLSETYIAGVKLWTIGFGNTETSGAYYPSRMKHVEVSYVPTNTCNGNNMYGGKITQNMMCAADQNKGSCHGDSGGPLYDKANGVLVGVVSWGYGCADPSYPGVYSRISTRWAWIRSTICNDVGSEKPGFCETSTTAPTASPPPDSCTDTPGWHDSDGEMYDCEWYGNVIYDDDDSYSERCSAYGYLYENEGQTANEACCACGGGKMGSSSPVASPVTSNDCQDTDEKFWYSPTQRKHCKFVGNKNTAKRCGKSGVRDQCPVTCEEDCTCFDTQGVFNTPNGKERNCNWASKSTTKRCRNYVVRSNCPKVCGICD